MYRILPLLGLLLLTSCAHRQLVWNHVSGQNDQQRFAQDKYVCVQESRTQTSGVFIGRNAYLANAIAQAEAQGQANRLWAMCMEARGWIGTIITTNP